jgi:hypothetical protein
VLRAETQLAHLPAVLALALREMVQHPLRRHVTDCLQRHAAVDVVRQVTGTAKVVPRHGAKGVEQQVAHCVEQRIVGGNIAPADRLDWVPPESEGANSIASLLYHLARGEGTLEGAIALKEKHDMIVPPSTRQAYGALTPQANGS